MPKKTRQEKIISQLRRKLKLQSQAPSNPSRDLPVKPETGISYVPAVSSSKNEFVSSSVPKTDYSYVFSDLKRIFSIIVCALTFQAILYFLLNVKGLSWLSQLVLKR